ncbi:threonine synthase [Thermosipho atlanticus]|uniref:Threonine synthase n=1 Tax=Thermosipho atlanticus DSM 15807 TaxID=1123380 RepID=A0A1M5QQZ6_9BACT|nr:threonine synthase [Thermosipho atlanticus]SHH16534.1 L-threonine synthase [Thermosipho atlanticus DSM 15807]
MYKLRCISCEKIYEPSPNLYTCPKCGERMGTLEVIYDYEKINIHKNDFDPEGDISQFVKILPIKNYVTHLKVGGTPLYKFKNVLGIKELLVKYDGTNPTASYKDRATAIAISKAYEYNYETIYCASTGNAASSLAGLSASTKLNTFIFVPASAPIAKIAQLYVYGANVIQIDGSYDEAFDISMEVGKRLKWYSRNSAINPYLLEGKKTGALEVIVQNNYVTPDVVLVGVGDGTVISSLYKGFYDFYKLGLINEIPRIIGIQAENADAIVKTFEKGKPYKPVDIESKTIADSISVGKPRDVIKACKYVEKSNGTFLRVSDAEILEAISEMAKLTGIFGEPAGAASYAGLKKAIKLGLIRKDESACIFVTGNGLKDIKSVEKLIKTKKVKPDIEEVLKFIKEVKV